MQSLLRDWLGGVGVLINNGTDFWSCHGQFFCSFWSIHGNFLGRNSRKIGYTQKIASPWAPAVSPRAKCERPIKAIAGHGYCLEWPFPLSRVRVTLLAQANCKPIVVVFFKIDEISPLEEALSTQVVHQLKDKGHPFSTSWGNGNSFLPMYSKDILIIALIPVIAIA